MNQAEKYQNIKEYRGLIDLTEISCDKGDDEDPLYEWVKEAE